MYTTVQKWVRYITQPHHKVPYKMGRTMNSKLQVITVRYLELTSAPEKGRLAPSRLGWSLWYTLAPSEKKKNRLPVCKSHKKDISISVASRIPDPNFFHPGSQNLSILIQKMVSQLQALHKSQNLIMYFYSEISLCQSHKRLKRNMVLITIKKSTDFVSDSSSVVDPE